VKGKDGKTFKVTKGAPQVVLAMSANAGSVKTAAEKAVNDFAARGFRSLGVARAEGDGAWQFLGVLPMFDPPRVDAKATIATALQMGVKIKMVTGDQLAIAREMAGTLGMGTNILDAKMLGDSKKQESAEVIESIEKADGFAEVFPEHKFHIVDVLQKQDHIVGMTGDGVNDAPALKKADCGIAVSSATDAARAAAAIVLLTPGLSVIIDAIKESRRIFQRMNSYAIYRIAETLRVLLFMTLAILVFNFYPLTAVMIVMLALLNDGAILSIAYDNVHYKDKPESWNMRMVLGVSTALGVIGVVAAFGLFYLGERVFHLDRAHIQTLMYLKLSVAGHLTIFLTRTRGPFWSIRPAKILLFAVFGTQAVATLIAVYGLFMTPLGWGWAGFVWGYALLWFLLNDRVKLLAYRIFDPAGANLISGSKANESKHAAKENETNPGTQAAKPDAADPKPNMKTTEPESPSKAEAKPEAKAEANPEAKGANPKPEANANGIKPDAQAAKPDAKAADSEPEMKANEPKSPGEAEPQPATDPKASSEGKAANPKPEVNADGTKLGAEATKPDGKPADSKADAKVTGPESAGKAKAKPQAKVGPNLEANGANSKVEANADETKPGIKTTAPQVKIDPASEAKTGAPSELTPLIAKRAFEIYQDRSRRDGSAVKDWERAEREVRTDGVKADPKSDATATEPSADTKAVEASERAQPKADAKAEVRSDAKPGEAKSEAKTKTDSDLTPQLVKRVHHLYEELGREDVRAVQDWEKAEHKKLEDQAHKQTDETNPADMAQK